MEAVAGEWRSAPLAPADRALCEFASRLTRRPQEVTEEDVGTLRAHGLDDRAIHDAVQVIAYFNYITRVADGLGVDPEPGLRRWGAARGGAP